jgi:hypothetical protein
VLRRSEAIGAMAPSDRIVTSRRTPESRGDARTRMQR